MLNLNIDYKNYHRDKEYQDNEALFRNIFKKRLNIISKHIKNPKKVLDIGCSNGVFLDLYKSRKQGIYWYAPIQASDTNLRLRVPLLQ